MTVALNFTLIWSFARNFQAIPAQYAATFGASLVPAAAVPAISRGIRPPNGARLAAEHPPHPVRLVGDVAALSLINRSGRHLAAAPAVAVAAAPAISYRAAAAPAISYRAAAAPAISYRTAAAPAFASAPAFVSAPAYASAPAFASAPAYASAPAFASAPAAWSAYGDQSRTYPTAP